MTTQVPEMRHYTVSRPGNILERLQFATVARPSKPVGKKEVLVEVVAAGLNPADYKMIELCLVSRAVVSYPKTPGMDFSGRAIAVGSDVPDIKAGDNVMGRIDSTQSGGSLSEYVVAPYDGLTTLPKDVSLHQAGAAATAALTAFQTITPYVKAGDKVFINGGSGGTGTFGIQIAKALGCHVTVSCSTGKIPQCKELGADEIIDYKKADVTAKLKEMGNVFAVAVDNVGNSPPDLFAATDHYLLPGGHFQFVGGHVNFASAKSLVPKALVPSFLGGSKHKLEVFFIKDSHNDLAQIAQWMGEGKVRTVVDSVFGFDEVPEAYKKLKGGSSMGKIVIHVKKEE